MSKHIGSMATLSICLLLAACGGNSSGGSAAGGGVTAATETTPVVNSVPVGAWSGSSSKGDAVDMLLLEDGIYYTIFRTDVAGAAPKQSFAQGSYAMSSDQFTASGTQYSTNPKVSGSLKGTLLNAPSGATLSGMATNSGGTDTGTFEVKPISAVDKNYDYNKSALLKDIAGPWSTAYLLGNTTNFPFTIDANTGDLANTNPVCHITATFTPRKSKKNVFDVTLKYGTSPCTQPGISFSGVALSYVAANNKQQLSAALLDDTNKSTPTMLYAQR